jgi:S-adenosylmethionine-dependent methyltransferase
MDEKIRAYYDRFGTREWQRLERDDDGSVEFLLTCHVLSSYLPKTARVLDIGGGPGRYTLWLAERGYQVVLADLSPELIKIAQEKVAASSAASQVEEMIVADARNLSHWKNASFDAVMALGPFYHLPDPTDRDRAARELVRVLRPDGAAFVALMPRYAFLRRTLALRSEQHHFADPSFIQQILKQGIFLNDRPGAFTGGYGVRPEEVEAFFSQYGLTMETLISTEGIVPDLQGELALLAKNHPVAHQNMLDIIIRTASDPGILGMANHLLYVGRRQG